jgi:hypothetical protein
MRNISEGFALRDPEDEALRPTFSDICNRFGAVDIPGGGLLLKISQHDRGNGLLDSKDRVVVGATLLRALVDAGL